MIELDETTVLLFAFVVLLVPFPLISIGTTEGIPTLWWAGIAMLIIGGAIPPIARYVYERPDGNGEDASAPE